MMVPENLQGETRSWSGSFFRVGYVIKMMKNCKLKKKFNVPIIVFLFLLSLQPLVFSISNSSIIYVDDDNTQGPWDGSSQHPFQRIQDAINVAEDGDTVFVLDGTYYEHIIVDKSIVLTGNDPQETIIDGTSTGTAVTILKENNYLSRFTIRHGHHSGILISSNENYIQDCYISDSTIGIILDESKNNTIINCDSSNNLLGISLKSSNNNQIQCSKFFNNTGSLFVPSGGVRISSGKNNIVESCAFSQNHGGVNLIDTEKATLRNNTFFHDGVGIIGDSMCHFIHSIGNNTVDNKSLRFYLNKSNVILNEDNLGQIILVNCSNFTIINASITDTNIGIEGAFCNTISLLNSVISHNIKGILFYHTSSSVISNCNITQNLNGLDLINSDFNIVQDNVVTATYLGIEIHEDSTHNTISSSDIIECNSGIKIYQSSNNRILSCHVYSSNDYGIRFFDSRNNVVSQCILRLNKNESLILHHLCDNNTIIDTNISNNGMGIHVIFSKNNDIEHCNFIGNDMGVCLDYRSDFNMVTNNNFLKNEVHAYFYDSFFNRWFQNYWDRWIGIGPWIIRGISKFSFPLYDFDLRPAREPYDTGGKIIF